MNTAHESVDESPAAVTAKIDRYTELGRYAEAERIARRALHARPEHINLLNKLSFTLFRQQRFEEDLEVTERALGLDPDEPVLYYRRGWTMWRLDRRDEAIELARRGLELDPHRELKFLLIRDLGRYYNWERRHPEAFEVVEQGLSDFPGDTEFLEVAGEALRRQNKYHEADTYLKASLGANPHLGINWYAKALNDMMLSRARPAMAGFAHSMLLEPDDDWRADRVRYFMGWPVAGYATAFRWSLPIAALAALTDAAESVPSPELWWGSIVLLTVSFGYATHWLFRGGKLAWTALPRLLPIEKVSLALPATFANLGLTATVTSLFTGSQALAGLGFLAGALLWPSLAFDNSLNPNEDQKKPLWRRTLANIMWLLLDDFTGHPWKMWRRLRHRLSRGRVTKSP